MKERTLSFLFLLFSILYLVLARELSYGSIQAPKAGFFPTIFGIFAILLSIAILINMLFIKKTKEADTINWRRIALVILGLVLYVILLSSTNYIIATFVIMFYLLKVSETIGWIFPGIISAGVAVSFYVLFADYLAINLP